MSNGRNLDLIARLLIHVCMSCYWTISELWGSYPIEQFGIHSLRAGGATTAAASSGVPDKLFKHHGR